MAYTHDQIITQFTDAHGDTYDYSQVKYSAGSSNVIIVCKDHGPFPQTPAKHKIVTLIQSKVFTDGAEAWDIEQSILKAHRDSKYTGSKILKSGNSELFKEDILSEILLHF